jgi:hypothetical protein
MTWRRCLRPRGPRCGSISSAPCCRRARLARTSGAVLVLVVAGPPVGMPVGLRWKEAVVEQEEEAEEVVALTTTMKAGATTAMAMAVHRRRPLPPPRRVRGPGDL